LENLNHLTNTISSICFFLNTDRNKILPCKVFIEKKTNRSKNNKTLLRGGDRGLVGAPTPARKFFFSAPLLTIFIFLA
jgi:hypothetical protein